MTIWPTADNSRFDCAEVADMAALTGDVRHQRQAVISLLPPRKRVVFILDHRSFSCRGVAWTAWSRTSLTDRR